MRQPLKALLVLVALTTFIAPSLLCADEGNLLKGIGPKKTRTPSMSLLLRDDLKVLFKDVMSAYLSKNKDQFLSYFADSLTMGSLELSGRRPVATKNELGKRLEKEFSVQDFSNVTFEEAFDLDDPTMVFVMSEEQLHDQIPVWGFAIEPDEIRKYMKPGDYLVIANTLPQLAEKVLMPTSIYFIVRKVENKYILVGLD